MLVEQRRQGRDSALPPLSELQQLAVSAGATVAARLMLTAPPVAGTFIGRGKVQQLAELVAQHEAQLVIFNHDISPVQERNLESAVQCRVLGRSALILAIFAQRATSNEGKLQVELAQLKHLSTRLVRGWTHLERQKGGIGLRGGPGETQLETDRRLITERIKTLGRKLSRVEGQRRLHRRTRQRAGTPVISLIGYTNAGKSSLFNQLTRADTAVKDQLFTTLDPTMRRLSLSNSATVVLSDTVGFVRGLPHTLVAAFKSTLEEVAAASCLLLVSDCSDPEQLELRHQVFAVLDEIGAGQVPIIHVYNKIDRLSQPARVSLDEQGRNAVWLSARTGEGVAGLRQVLTRFVTRERQLVRLQIKPAAGALRARLYRECDVLEEQTTADGCIQLLVSIHPARYRWFRGQPEYTGLWVCTSGVNAAVAAGCGGVD